MISATARSGDAPRNSDRRAASTHTGLSSCSAPRSSSRNARALVTCGPRDQLFGLVQDDQDRLRAVPEPDHRARGRHLRGRGTHVRDGRGALGAAESPGIRARGREPTHRPDAARARTPAARPIAPATVASAERLPRAPARTCRFQKDLRRPRTGHPRAAAWAGAGGAICRSPRRARRTSQHPRRRRDPAPDRATATRSSQTHRADRPPPAAGRARAAGSPRLGIRSAARPTEDGSAAHDEAPRPRRRERSAC